MNIPSFASFEKLRGWRRVLEWYVSYFILTVIIIFTSLMSYGTFSKSLEPLVPLKHFLYNPRKCDGFYIAAFWYLLSDMYTVSNLSRYSLSTLPTFQRSVLVWLGRHMGLNKKREVLVWRKCVSSFCREFYIDI